MGVSRNVGAKNPKAKLTEIKVKEILKHLDEGLSTRKIGRYYGISAAHISGIKNKKFWKHL